MESRKNQTPLEESTRNSKILEVSIWTGVLAFAFLMILWALHNWLGLWIVVLYEKYDFADTWCEYCAEKAPLYFVGKGFAKSSTAQGCVWLVGRSKACIPYLTDYLKSDEKYSDLYWLSAYRNLFELKEIDCEYLEKNKTVYKLLEFTRHRDRYVQSGSIDFLVTIGKPKSRIIPRFISMIQSGKRIDRQLSINALRNLEDIEGYAQDMVSCLSVSLHDTHHDIRRDTAYLFGRIYEETEDLPAPPYKAVRALIHILKEDNDSETKDAALYALGELGLCAKEVFPLLKEMRDSCSNWRINHTIAKIGIIREWEMLEFVKTLESDNFWRKMGADVDLREMKAKEEASILITLLDDNKRNIRIAAFEALRNMGSDAKEALPVLMKKTKEGYETTRMFAARALVGIAPKNNDIRKILLECFYEEHSTKVKLVILWELGNMQPPVLKAVPDIVKALKDKNDWVRYGAAKALGRIGGDSVWIYLMEALSLESSEKVKDELQRSIEKIESKKPESEMFID